MSAKQVEGKTELLFNRLSYKQMRHVVLLEVIVELAKVSVERWKKHDVDGGCGIDDAIDIMVAEMMGLEDRAWVYTCYNPRIISLNQKMFEKVDTSDDNDQMLVYESAVATSKYRLEKLMAEMCAKEGHRSTTHA